MSHILYECSHSAFSEQEVNNFGGNVAQDKVVDNAQLKVNCIAEGR